MGLTKERFHGCIYGLAIGDALGYPVEFLSYDEIRQQFPPNGVLDFIPPKYRSHPLGTFSDDTQMSLAIAEALIRHKSGDIEDYMKLLTEQFIKWVNSPENDREPGSTCLASCYNLVNGVSWRESGSVESLGCGTSMRSAPIGLYYATNISKMIDFAQESSRITHAHPITVAGGISTAWCVRAGLLDLDLKDWFPALEDDLIDLSLDFVNKIRIVPHILDQLKTTPNKIGTLKKPLGSGFLAHEATALALLCVYLHPDDFNATIIEAANLGGDTDSIACIAGAIQGARLGLSSIRKDWIQKVEKSAYLGEIADRLWSTRWNE